MNKKTNECPPARRLSAKAGFSLVEVTMALGLVSFCLVAMIGMLPVGLKQERVSSDQMAAMQLLAKMGGAFQNTPTGDKIEKLDIQVSSGQKGSVLVDNAFEKAASAAQADYNLYYDISGSVDAVGGAGAVGL